MHWSLIDDILFILSAAAFIYALVLEMEITDLRKELRSRGEKHRG